MSRVGVRETIRRYSARIGLTKYWAEEVVTVWNMTHQFWLDESGEVTVNTSKRLERFCDFVKDNEYLPLKAIAEKYCLKHNVPFITEDKKKVYLRAVFAEDAAERIAKLEQDNTELRERCSIFDKALITSTKNNIERQELIDGLKDQVSAMSKASVLNTSEADMMKAKVIIQNLLDSFFAVEGDQARELEAVKEARKFLKEE